ncbi:DUF3566 domain-containing protein (plasmid) [Streptomyces mirabilis]|uniref:DUF3566 domain-containing protein n=2 Tax=Streptomyces mirabilis TaxID=68239 RepID=A0ABU3V5W7_9ACTN|nr:DUF3566 domain-containing protein [Streptomyces mirabilis]MDU9001564.1 DUF3566 domain-containing protein [Streptomyces mirabilis]
MDPDSSAGSRPCAAVGPALRPRKLRMRISQADPWSVMKVSFLLSLAVGIYMIVSVAVLWAVPATIGLIDPAPWLSPGWVLKITAAVAVINTGLATSLATLAAFVYNATARFVGGSELTLSEGE